VPKLEFNPVPDHIRPARLKGLKRPGTGPSYGSQWRYILSLFLVTFVRPVIYKPKRDFLVPRGEGYTPTDFIRRCPARGPDPLPFSHTKFCKFGTLSHTKFRKLAPFHIPFPEKELLSHTPSLKKGPLSHTWSPKRYPFRAEHPRIVHCREYPGSGNCTPCSKFPTANFKD